TIAGGRVYSGNGGRATEASLSDVRKIILDGAGNIILADVANQTVRQVDAATGIITTIAGGGDLLADNVPATVAMIMPISLALDGAGNIFIGDEYTYSVRRVDAVTREITTVVGGMRRPFGGDGGPAAKAGLGDRPEEIAFDRNGNLFILAASRVRRVD